MNYGKKMGAEQKNYQKPVIRFVTDVEVVLECLHEVYRLEGERVRSGKNVYNTMVFPFLKMLESHCNEVLAMRLHEILWKTYEENPEKEDFFEKAGVLIQPYLKGEKEDEDAEKGLYKSQMDY